MSTGRAFDRLTSNFGALAPDGFNGFKRQPLKNISIKRFGEPHAIRCFIGNCAYEIGKFISDIRKAQLTVARYEALSWLSDGELAHRGMTRTDIPHSALDGRKE